MKTWSSPADDAYLAPFAKRLPTVSRFFQKLHPGERYYMTNIYARKMRPEDVRQWRDDLWMFPHYTNKTFVPYDARRGKAAAATWSTGKKGE